MRSVSVSDPCPCGRRGTFAALQFQQCCGPYLSGTASVPDPESLMRSRFTAFATGAREYLAQTWDPLTRPQPLELDAEIQWLRLDVIQAGADGDTGHVEFAAHFRVGTSAESVHHEHSRFRRVAGHWLYLDDQALS